MRYTVLLEPEEDGGFVVSVPALPGCISQGDTREEALANIREAIAVYVEDCREAGDPAPEFVRLRRQLRLVLAAMRQAGLLAGSLASKARGEHPSMSLAIPAHARSDNLRGILAMLASMAVFVVNDTLMKIAAGHLPTGEAIFLRGLFTTAFGAALIVASGDLAQLPHALSPTVLWRAAADLGGTITLPHRARAHADRPTSSASCSSRRWR